MSDGGSSASCGWFIAEERWVNGWREWGKRTDGYRRDGPVAWSVAWAAQQDETGSGASRREGRRLALRAGGVAAAPACVAWALKVSSLDFAASHAGYSMDSCVTNDPPAIVLFGGTLYSPTVSYNSSRKRWKLPGLHHPQPSLATTTTTSSFYSTTSTVGKKQPVSS